MKLPQLMLLSLLTACLLVPPYVFFANVPAPKTIDHLLIAPDMIGYEAVGTGTKQVLSLVAEAGQRDSVYLCPGDAVSLKDRSINEAGQYYLSQGLKPSETTDTLDVFALRDTLTSTTYALCAGDSAMFFGAYVWESVEGSRVYTASNGCDSTHHIEVIVYDSIRTREALEICAGDSVHLFGIYEQTPGVYSKNFTSTKGCDSTHVVELAVNNFFISVTRLRRDCGGANAGWGEVTFESDGMFEVLWSDGSYFARNERLFAGLNTVTVTDGNGCTVSDTLVMEAAVAPSLESYISDESCPGANDGEIGLITDRDKLRFSLGDGPWLANSTFRGLADGKYQVEIKDEDGCRSKEYFEVEAAVTYSLDLPGEVSLDLGDSLVLSPITDFPPAQIRWKTNDTLTCDGCAELRLRPARTMVMTALAGYNDECATLAKVQVNVNREDLFFVPDTFNVQRDEFRVYPGQAVTHINSLAVYDQWGNPIYLREDFLPEDVSDSWDGTLADRSTPARGVYVYQVLVELFTGEVVSQAGEVVVVR